MVVVSTGLRRSLQNFNLHKVERSWRSLAFFKMAILKELIRRDGNVLVFVLLACFGSAVLCVGGGGVRNRV